MPSGETAKVDEGQDLASEETLRERLVEATHVLEELAAKRSLLLALPLEYRRRIQKAAGDIYCPDVAQRRLLNKATHKRRKKEKIARDQKTLNQSGIRTLRKKPVFTTPNVYPPKGFEPAEVSSEGESREVVDPQNCYICKQDYS